MAAAAISQCKMNHSYSICDSNFIHPLSVIDLKEINIILDQDSDTLTYEVRDEENTYAKGRYQVSDHREQNPPLSIHTIKVRCTDSIDKNTLYENFKNIGIVYGPYFQGLEKIWMNNKEALGKYDLSWINEQAPSEYTLHPGIVDSALQTVAGLYANSAKRQMQPVIPFAVKNVNLFKQLEKKGYTYADVCGENRFNVLILDEAGHVCLKIKDIIFREVKKAYGQNDIPEKS